MKRSILATVALVAGSLIGLEIAVTRIYSVVLWYHFAFLAVSVCLFGMGVAGIFLHLLGDRQKEKNTGRDLCLLAVGQGLAVVIAITALLQMRMGSLSMSAGMLVRLAGIFFLSAVPFFFGGAFLSLAIRRYHQHVGRIYFADLVGASLGCLSVIPLLSLFGAPATAYLYGLTAVVAALVLAQDLNNNRLKTLSVVVGTILLIVVALSQWVGFFQVRYSKGNAEPEHLVERWNSFSRVIAYPRQYVEDGRTVKDVMMEIDGVAHTPINPFDGDPKNSWFHTFDLSALPFSIKPDADLLIFGSGGGEHIITALPFKPHHITGVEMNPIVVNLVRNEFSELAGGILDLPNVSIVIDEGRSFLARTKEFYDVIQFTLVDTWASTVSGGYVLTENHVFTEEAFTSYFNRLKPGGLLTLKRWFKADDMSVEEYTLRLVSLTRAVMAKSGRTDFSENYFIAGYSEFANLIVKPDGFSLDEVLQLLDFCSEHGLEVIYSPFYQMEENNFHKLIGAPDMDDFIRKYPFDISPVNDNRPFFFYTLRPGDMGRLFSLSYSAKVRNIGPLVLVGLLVVVILAVGLFIFLPLALTRQSIRQVGGPKEALKFAAYFGLIGVGFLLVEIALMQKFILFLGHPIYALAVILFSILLFGGFGSHLSQKISDQKIRRSLIGILIALILFASGLVLASPLLMDRLIGLSALAKAAVSMLLLAPVGLAIGMPFPLGVRLLAGCDERLIPWMWAVNSAGSVLGSVLAMVLAVHLGFTATILLGLVCYLLVAILV